MQSVDDMEAQAALWAARLDAAPDRDYPDLDEWLVQNPRHVGALLRAQGMLAAFSPPAVQEAASSEEGEAGNRFPAVWKRKAIFGGATGFAIAASLAAFLLIMPAREAYETQVGEVLALALSDGSTVAIDAQSRIKVAYNKTSRDVHMVSGKVLFRAVHEGGRPFRVILDNVTVTDIGTAFQVDRDDAGQSVDVLVTEGAVWVDAPVGRQKLVAGQHARFSQLPGQQRAEPVRSVNQADIERALAWREGQLELNGETLAVAVAQFNRHSRVQLRVGDRGLSNESLYGSFRFDDAAGFARTVAAGLGVTATADDGAIVIGPEKKSR